MEEMFEGDCPFKRWENSPSDLLIHDISCIYFSLGFNCIKFKMKAPTYEWSCTNSNHKEFIDKNILYLSFLLAAFAFISSSQAFSGCPAVVLNNIINTATNAANITVFFILVEVNSRSHTLSFEVVVVMTLQKIEICVVLFIVYNFECMVT